MKYVLKINCIINHNDNLKIFYLLHGTFPGYNIIKLEINKERMTKIIPLEN